MKDFDAERRARLERDRSFQLGGETFTMRPSVAPEATLRWSQMAMGEIGVERELPVLDGKGEATGNIRTRKIVPEAEALDIFDETVLAFLEPGQEEKWATVRGADVELPLTIDDLRELIEWLFEAQTGRPTGPSSDSTPGSGDATSTTTSTVASGSPAEAAA